MNGRVYKLVGGGKYYYGSTIRDLAPRFNEHKYSAKKGKQGGCYAYFNEIGWDKVRIELVEEVSCETIRDLQKRENDYIEASLNDEGCLNRQRSFRTDEVRRRLEAGYNEKRKLTYSTNREREVQYRREWYAKNREEVKRKARERYRNLKDASKII